MDVNDGLQERGEKDIMLGVPRLEWEFRVTRSAGKPQGAGACVGLKSSDVGVTILSTRTHNCKLGPAISKPTSF